MHVYTQTLLNIFLEQVLDEEKKKNYQHCN